MSLIQLSQSLLNQVKHKATTWLQDSGLLKPMALSSALNKPLLTSEEIIELADELAILTSQVKANPIPSDALRQGEQSSLFMGAGLEYEESRPYELGDEIRRINWHLMAKTGKAYTKLFQEERQESWFILVDQRQSMRFGTRKRLKATQATRVAGYFAWLSQKATVPVVGARLTTELEMTPILEGRGTYTHLMEKFSAACPPLADNNNNIEPHLNDVLINITQQIQPGSRLIIISDFHDINPKTTEILTALQRIAMVKAICINDPAELQLPEVDGLQLESLDSQQTVQIDSQLQRLAYQTWSEKYHQQLQMLLQAAGLEPISMLTDEPMSTFSCFKRAVTTSEGDNNVH
ncbi:MAG: hypothetical protein ISEC1_P0360 [Thiomicrorhabdus sp.]|nr:MAG: hypothetical protein ISEC1_P0360 [Thiomicrorhabdus sp.]